MIAGSSKGLLRATAVTPEDVGEFVEPRRAVELDGRVAGLAGQGKQIAPKVAADAVQLFLEFEHARLQACERARVGVRWRVEQAIPGQVQMLLELVGAFTGQAQASGGLDQRAAEVRQRALLAQAEPAGGGGGVLSRGGAFFGVVVQRGCHAHRAVPKLYVDCGGSAGRPRPVAQARP